MSGNQFVKQTSTIPHVSINANIINDNTLSWQATGLYVYMCSKPDGWVYRRQDFINAKTNGRDATQTAINELKEQGFLQVIPTKDGTVYTGKAYRFFPDRIPERLKTRSSVVIALPPTPAQKQRAELDTVRNLQLLDQQVHGTYGNKGNIRNQR